MFHTSSGRARQLSNKKVLVAYGTVNITRAMDRARVVAARGDQMIVVGITRYARTHRGCWQVCISRQGDPVTWVSAHRLKQSAEEQILLVQQAVWEGALADDTKFAALLQELSAYGEQDLEDTLASTAGPMMGVVYVPPSPRELVLQAYDAG